MVIRVLSTQLANQIAAGEVVERPASVIKELVENSIDAGATRIDIEVDQGGIKRMRVQDNGCGINKDELSLALARHATSKITQFDDLAAIVSLGFRGEALASIGSVSRLTLISRTENQSQAWQVYAEGREMETTLKPAAHPVGTTVDVLDLFYNTPARRRFLKTDKTEFTHIDEIIKKIALGSPQITINLQHNGKLIRQYPGIPDNDSLARRLKSVCGQRFMDHAIKLEWEHDDLKIVGWVNAQPSCDCQYFYVNNRVVKDRVLNHAIRQVYDKNKNDGKMGYVIYLHIDPHQVDVNVHPTKHEVRFHEARLVHDFVYQALLMTITKNGNESVLPLTNESNCITANRPAAGTNIFSSKPNYSSTPYTKKCCEITQSRRQTSQLQQPIYQELINSEPNQTSHLARHDDSTNALHSKLFPDRNEPFVLSIPMGRVAQLGSVVTLLSDDYAILKKNNELQLLSIKNAHFLVLRHKVGKQNKTGAEKLLISLQLTINKTEKVLFDRYKALLETVNLLFDIDKNKLRLHAVPKLLRNLNWQQLMPLLAIFLNKTTHPFESTVIADWLVNAYIEHNQLSNQQDQWTQSQTVALLTELEQIAPDEKELGYCVQSIDLSEPLSVLKSKLAR